MTVQPFIGKDPNCHTEAYLLAPATLIEDGPIHPLLLTLVFMSPLFWVAILWTILV